MKKSLSYLLYLCSFLFIACSDDSSEMKLQYDQQAFLTNIGQNIITPRYESLQSKLADLETKANTFSTTPSTSELQSLKSSFLTAYEQFQSCAMFDFGPAEGSENLNRFNIYPINATTIESNISSGSYDLESANQIDTKGFPAIDYLLYHSDEATIVNEFATENRKTYLKDIVADLKKEIERITNEWKSSYTNSFIGNTGNSAGSSVALLINQFNYSFEDGKNFKVGIPSGSRSSLGTTFSKKVEAYYSGHSLKLTQVHLNYLRDLYTGTSLDGTNGIGFDDYLNDLNRQNLNNRIQEKLTIIETSLKRLETVENGIFSMIVENNNSSLSNTYDTYSATVPLIKSEMPSILGIAITYQDGDGD